MGLNVECSCLFVDKWLQFPCQQFFSAMTSDCWAQGQQAVTWKPCDFLSTWSWFWCVLLRYRYRFCRRWDKQSSAGSTFLVLLVPLVILWCKSNPWEYILQFFPRRGFRVTMNSWGQWAPTLFIVTLNPVVRQLIVQDCQSLWVMGDKEGELWGSTNYQPQWSKKVIGRYKSAKRQENMYLI
jgi:hypothetical protein